MAYRQPNGKKNRMIFGKYPIVTLAEAGVRRLEVRRLLDQGIDPGRAKREKKETRATVAQHTSCAPPSGQDRSRRGRMAHPRLQDEDGQDHIVPLATQAVELLSELHAMTGNGKFVFPSVRTGERCMSENTINLALRSMDYGKDLMIGHGFRAITRTIMDEVLAEQVDLIEHQLAHAVKDPNGRAYNRTAHLPARRLMMQRWADYLNAIKLAYC